jgi:hypothetical protein
MRQHQVIFGQRQPQLLFQPGQCFAKATRFARQPAVVLAQRRRLYGIGAAAARPCPQESEFRMKLLTPGFWLLTPGF